MQNILHRPRGSCWSPPNNTTSLRVRLTQHDDHRKNVSSFSEEEKMSKTRNIVFATGLIAGVTACGLFPSYYVKRQKKNLHQADKPLNGTQIMRGMYLNSGSRFVDNSFRRGQKYTSTHKQRRWT